MYAPSSAALEARLAEVVMRDLFPCDLGDATEVVHAIEVFEIEMECDVEHSEAYETLELVWPDCERSPICDTLPFAPYEPPEVAEDLATSRFARVLDPALVRDTLAETVPYPRIWFGGDAA